MLWYTKEDLAQPDVIGSTVGLVINDFNPPSYRIRGDTQRSPRTDPIYRSTELFRPFRANLRSTLFTCGGGGCLRVISPFVSYIQPQTV